MLSDVTCSLIKVLPLFFYFDFGFFDVFLLDISMFFLVRLFVSILRLQTASPNLKNNCFSKEILTFLKNQGFVLEDWFGSFLALFLAHVGVLYGVSGALRSIKLGLQIRAFLSKFVLKTKKHKMS